MTQALYPLYRERCPHPVSLAGLLEMGMPFLPTNANWKHFIRQADDAREELEAETLRNLSQVWSILHLILLSKIKHFSSVMLQNMK